MPWVALVGPEIEENLSLRYLASSLASAGYESRIVAFQYDTDFGRVLDEILGAPEPPFIIGISLAFQWRAQESLALAIALRDRGYRGHITAGGHFATFAGKEILNDFNEIDTIVCQEAEETLVQLCHAVKGGRSISELAGIVYRDEHGRVHVAPPAPLPDLARLPPPDRRGEPAACFGHGIAPLVGSRGCYANCSFCCIAAWHEQSLPGKRYRLREVDAIADEMVAMNRDRGIDIFVFHDDNFFMPGHKKNQERFSALADAIEARGLRRFATVVKARPTDVHPDVFRILTTRLKCIRVYIGIETDADQGLTTLRRWSGTKQNRSAIRLVRELDLYTCFNMLIFDPDTTIESLETNVAFMRFAAEYPSNFGRVELYAGTPLLARMQAEGRCTGDYLQWDYALGDRDVERVFSMAMSAFHARNFGEGALNNRIMGTRFDLEVCRHFHPEVVDPSWLAEGKHLTRELTFDSANTLEAIIERVKSKAPVEDDNAFIAELTPKLRAKEFEIREATRELARTLQKAVGHGRPLTDIGDKVATPLQSQRAEI